MLDEKMNHFTRMMMNEALQEGLRIQEEIQTRRAASIRETEAEASRVCERWLAEQTAVIQAESSQEISHCAQESRRALCLRREEIAREITGQVRTEIQKYTGTERYAARLCRLLAESASRFDGAEKLTVYLREEDMHLVPQLTESMKAGKGIVAGLVAKLTGRGGLEFRTGDFALGGLILESSDQGLRLDATFDTELEMRSAQLIEQMGLSLET